MHRRSRKSDQLIARMILSDSRAPKMRKILTNLGIYFLIFYCQNFTLKYSNKAWYLSCAVRQVSVRYSSICPQL